MYDSSYFVLHYDALQYRGAEAVKKVRLGGERYEINTFPTT